MKTDPIPASLRGTCEVADAFELKYAAVYAYIRRGQFPAPKQVIGGTWLWTPEEVEAFGKFLADRTRERYVEMKERCRKAKERLEDPEAWKRARRKK
jgi:hypothetical protein